MYSFVEGCGIVTKTGSSLITGFYKEDGSFTTVSGNCNVTYNLPFFSNNYLLVDENNYYRFINTDGDLCEGKYKKAYPFFNGYASCEGYVNVLKRKDPYQLLLTKNNESVIFSYNGKTFDVDDLEFISSINDDNIGFINKNVFLSNESSFPDSNINFIIGFEYEEDLEK